MHERVDAVEKGHNPRVTTQEITLKVRFQDREHPSKDRLMFKPKNTLAMSLCNFNHTHLGRYQPLCRRLGNRIEQIVDSPIEHLHQEGKFVQDAAVDMVGPTRGVRRGDRNATHALCFDRVGRLSTDFIWRVKIPAGIALVGDSIAEYAVIFAAIEHKRANHDAHDHLSLGHVD